MNNLLWFIGILVILWVTWFATGGPEKGNVEKPFIKPPTPLDTGETYGSAGFLSKYQRKPSGALVKKSSQTPGNVTQASSSANKSTVKIFTNTVSFGTNRGAQVEPQKEYLEIIADRKNTQPINITGWQLKSAVTGKSATVGSGAYLPEGGGVNVLGAVFLRPGEKAYIATGHSPIGSSFRLNACTGYFEQFQDFAPSLPRQCPSQKNEILPEGLSDQCLDFIESIRRCEAYIKATPLGIENACQQYISEKINYVGCVAAHKSELNFYKEEWRIYLGRNEELWKARRETILLYDERGVLVDSLSY